MSRPMASWVLRIAGILAAAAATIPGTGLAQTRASESAVKAAYLFHFAQFVRWPATAHVAGQPFTICVVGEDPFGRILDTTVAREVIDGHRITVKRVERVTRATGCHIAYVGDMEEERIDGVIRTLASTPALTVSDLPRFIARGGILQFVSINNRVRFEINLGAADAAGLVLSSELARVASAVHRLPVTP
jgi:hypothetical protein